jgi:hypothetical protein
MKVLRGNVAQLISFCGSFVVVFLTVVLSACGAARDPEGVNRLSWQQGLYRIEHGSYREVVVAPTAIYLIPVTDTQPVDQLWNDPGRASAERRMDINQSRQKAKQRGFDVPLRYVNADSAAAYGKTQPTATDDS